MDKLAVGFFADPIIGGWNDWSDDRSNYVAEENYVYCWDNDGSGDQGRSTDTLAFLTLEAPDGLGLTSVVSLLFGGDNEPRNDELVWQNLVPGNFSVLNQGVDHVLTFGSGYFALQPGETKTYAIAALLAGDDLSTTLAEAQNAYDIVTSLPSEYSPPVPRTARLHQNYPNPFNPGTVIGYSLSVSSDMLLEVFDLSGRKVRTLINGSRNSGSGQVQWDGTSDTGLRVASGIYFYRLATEDFIQTRKMLLTR